MPRPRIASRPAGSTVSQNWSPGQADKIRAAKKVSNPGCYPTGAVALIRPLVDAGLMPADYPVTINAVSGYTGGGKSMIASFEDGTAPAFELYGLGFEHKHLPETQLYAKLTRRPIFVPSVGNYRQGMLVSVPLHLDTLPGKPSGSDLHAALAKRYAGSKYVSVMPLDNTAAKNGRLEPEALNETNMLELYVFASAEHGQAVLLARLDNLGKGRVRRGSAEHAADAGTGVALLSREGRLYLAAPLVRRRDFFVRHCDSALPTHCRVRQTFQTERPHSEGLYSRS
jgi:N-acetyl-gamma-glutamyl-phosphate reductase